MATPPTVRLTALEGLPEFHTGGDLAQAILDAAQRNGLTWVDGDIVVVAQKVVSKTEGKVVDLRAVTPSVMARSFAGECGKDPRLIELALQQSRRIVKMDRGILVCESRHGLVCANAGVDQSNVPGPEHATILPDDPDGSARALRERLLKATGVQCAVLISDTFGRPWRKGLVDVAIGAAGLQAVEDRRGALDRDGRALDATQMAAADQIAAAAGLLMRKESGRPVVVIQGLKFEKGDGGAADLIRSPQEDLFR